jgi:branched-chain amino acid transport system substrate-binding protein
MVGTQMNVLTLTAVERVDAPPAAVFGLFGSGSGAGWVFDALCDRVAVGAAVLLRAPLDGPGDEPVEIHGRICKVAFARRIDISHEQPWRGQLTIRFDPDGAGTKVRINAALDERGLDWLMRRRGIGTPLGEPLGTARLGLLTSKSGPGSLFAAACDGLVQMAIDEINADGGVSGRPVELVVGDDSTDPEVGVAEAKRLVAAGCRTILASTTSATFAAVVQALSGAEVLVVQSLMNEGGYEGPLCLQMGERPFDQLAAAAVPVMQSAGGNRWFLAGNDYCWPHSVHRAARHLLPRYGAELVGERLAPLGSKDFTAIIEAVLRSGADAVLSTFVGADSALFERQCYAMGLRERCRTLSPALDESTLERIGPTAATGLYAVSGYFEGMEHEGNRDLLSRYRNTFGQWAPKLSSLSECGYEAAHIWAMAASRAGVDDPRGIAREMRRGYFDMPRGRVRLDRDAGRTQQLYLGEAVGGSFSVADPH